MSSYVDLLADVGRNMGPFPKATQEEIEANFENWFPEVEIPILVAVFGTGGLSTLGLKRPKDDFAFAKMLAEAAWDFQQLGSKLLDAAVTLKEKSEAN